MATSAASSSKRNGMLPAVLLRAGPAPLTDRQIIEVILGRVLGARSAADAARDLFERFGGLPEILAATPYELVDSGSLSVEAIAMLRLVRECSLRLARGRLIARPVLGNWQALLDYLHAAMAREREEQFRILFLDTRNRLLADEVQARGTVNHTPVYPREVVKRALELRATALILVHNHPSGDPTPSRADIEVTREVKQAADALGIALHDHIIVGLGRYASFRQEGLL